VTLVNIATEDSTSWQIFARAVKVGVLIVYQSLSASAAARVTTLVMVAVWVVLLAVPPALQAKSAVALQASF